MYAMSKKLCTSCGWCQLFDGEAEGCELPAGEALQVRMMDLGLGRGYAGANCPDHTEGVPQDETVEVAPLAADDDAPALPLEGGWPDPALADPPGDAPLTPPVVPDATRFVLAWDDGEREEGQIVGADEVLRRIPWLSHDALRHIATLMLETNTGVRCRLMPWRGARED
jgi:hypothetical protein